MVGLRAEPFADDALDPVELELYLGARAIPNPCLEGVECLWRNAPLGPVIRDAEAQEFALLW